MSCVRLAGVVQAERAGQVAEALLVDGLQVGVGEVELVQDFDLPGGPGAAYVAGEARTCQMVRDHLVRERDWPRTSIKVKPFWAPGKRGLH